METRITEFKISPQPTANQRGVVVVGQFAARMGGVWLKGCALAWAPSGWLILPPKCLGPGYRVDIDNEDLRVDLTTKARAAYAAFGGTFVEPETSPELDDGAGLSGFLGVDPAVAESLEQAGL